jgi:hypothetical protein
MRKMIVPERSKAIWGHCGNLAEKAASAIPKMRLRAARPIA